MKKLVLIIFLFGVSTFAQEFTVTKVTGQVMILKGTEEKATLVNKGDKLNGNDLLITDNNSLIQLDNNGKVFLLKSNSALGLNNIKNISINDLLLQLAVEDIKRLPGGNQKSNGRTTAVYGSEIGENSSMVISEDMLGEKKLNGAKQLSEEGYPKSAIIVARETFRKHPKTKKRIGFKIYFANQLYDLKLFEEAASEFVKIQKLNLSEKQKADVDEMLRKINLKLASQ